jgi:hypothetical protein
MICILSNMFEYQPEGDPWRVETWNWLTYNFYKVVLLTVVNLPLSRRTSWPGCVRTCSRSEILEEFSRRIWMRETIWCSGLDGRVISRCQYLMKGVHSMRNTSEALMYNIILSTVLYYCKYSICVPGTV